MRIAEALLEREILDGDEVMQIINGEHAAADSRPSRPKDTGDGTQQVLRPEAGRRLPGLSEGERPQPA